MLLRLTVATAFAIMMIVVVNCKVIASPHSSQMRAHGDVANSPKQLLFLTGVGKETTTPDFVRLVVMRFVYGLATSMGVEDRLESLFNGAFVPPNADGDFFGFGGLGGGDDGGDIGDIGDLGDLAGLEGLFEGDGLFEDGGF